MSKTIFISSTYRDLREHRKQIWNILQNFDVVITGMEEFGARNSTPLETCLRELEQSDIYLAIISMCYGSVDSLTGKSYTQLEYDKAKELGLDILIYLVDESNGELKVGNIDFGDKKLALDSFKRILMANHTVDFFINERDLGEKVYKRITKIIPEKDIEIVRPENLDTKIERIQLGETSWIIFITFYNGKPFEIFSGLSDDEEGVMLPKTVESGYINKREEDGYTSFDFTFNNRRGYRTTIEGVNDLFDVSLNLNDRIVSKLLQHNSSKTVIFDVIKELEIENPELKLWKDHIIRILNPLL